MSGEHASLSHEPKEERRTRREVRVVVPTELQEGWLAFQSGAERRRLAPIPPEWAALDESGLLAWLDRADRIAES